MANEVTMGETDTAAAMPARAHAVPITEAQRHLPADMLADAADLTAGRPA